MAHFGPDYSKQYLEPSMEFIRSDYVLMQAWKKTTTYLRSHSWYADTFGIDYESLRLPQFIGEIQERLQQPEKWQTKPIFMVPAPKNQRWEIKKRKWQPQGSKGSEEMRPLAHVNLQDQVVATAILLCTADRVETLLGNPSLNMGTELENRKKVIAYGNRLFCDATEAGELRHRWGSSKLYRQYFQDYRSFLERPKLVVKWLSRTINSDYEIAVVQSDLSKFYDRVRPKLLEEKLINFCKSPEEDDFFALANRIFDWRWAEVDIEEAKRYATEHNISNFELVALPQGLVSAGYFANIALYDFDKALRSKIGKELPNNKKWTLEDACYYVDDLRLVLKVPRETGEEDVKKYIFEWLQDLLEQNTNDLIISEHKTEVIIEGRETRFFVRQSSEADRIQHQVSGTFDMHQGTEIIAAIEGFFQKQQRFSTVSNENNGTESGFLVGVPDMRDETAARFAAGKFRRTYRSLRPLLDGQNDNKIFSDNNEELDDEATISQQLILTKEQLDERAKLFAASLIEEWIKNPGNVRLLRIALDIYPDQNFLEPILEVLRPKAKTRKPDPHRYVKLYCLSELFRAGATETGLVEDKECLPDNLDIEKYHEVLVAEAYDIINIYLKARKDNSRYPWYLMQQVFMYLGVRNAFPKSIVKKKSRAEILDHCWEFACFLSGKRPKDSRQFAIFMVMARTAYGIDFATLGLNKHISPNLLIEVDNISPNVALDLWNYCCDEAPKKLLNTAQKLGLEYQTNKSHKTLAEVANTFENPFFEEENLLRLADQLLNYNNLDKRTITPWEITYKYEKADGYTFGKIDGIEIIVDKGNHNATLFEPPTWCESDEERYKYQVGVLLRYALRGSIDLYSNWNGWNSRNAFKYKKPVSHWEQQRYSGYQGRNAFGPAWIPVSSFTEELLFELLRWPGAGALSKIKYLDDLRKSVKYRLAELLTMRGSVTSATFLEQEASWAPNRRKQSMDNSIRIGIVQSVVPTFDDYAKNIKDLTLDTNKEFRKQQRRHLATIMAGVSQMLRVRETHCNKKSDDGRKIDLLIFPELAIHQEDINTLIIPFVRSHKCIALFGQVYHRQDTRLTSPLINSCLWVIPEWDATKGLQIRRVEQGKNYLTRDEKGIKELKGFRPAQWLIKYQWNNQGDQPVIMSASICYDATDLSLAADLRDRSDLYIVCALNKDVATFDRMAESLHYHMYQGVMVVNNGLYGGSNLYLPLKARYERQIFHVHGQPQATISFVEVPTKDLIARNHNIAGWKTPPAGWKGIILR